MLRTLESLGDLAGKRVLVRADFNVPLDGQTITDDGRIQAALPTLNYLLKQGAAVVITAHLGRPAGTGVEEKYSLAPVANRLSDLLGTPVILAGDVSGPQAQADVAALQPGQVLLLENARFDARETSKDDAQRDALASELAGFADAFVSDGFGVVHRKQASVYDVAKKLPSAAGLLVQQEVEALSRATTDPARPYAVVLGGSKVSDKLGVIENLLTKADRLLIGGGMVFTFLAAQGYSVGKSLLESDQIEQVAGYLQTAQASGVELILPQDILVAPEFSAQAPATDVPANEIPEDQLGLDIGTAAQTQFAQHLADAQTIVWNGPMGVFEFPAFAGGTRAVAQAMVDATARGAFTIIGGGDSAAAIRQLGFTDSQFSHVSTGGGASLELLEGKTLPGLAVLEA